VSERDIAKRAVVRRHVVLCADSRIRPGEHQVQEIRIRSELS